MHGVRKTYGTPGEHTGMIRKLLPLGIAAALIGIGTLAIYDARKSAQTYGLPSEDRAALGFVRACGARDVVVGLILLSRLRDARTILMYSSLIAIADFTIVSVSSQETPPPSSLAIHGAGALGLMIGAFWA